MRNEIVVNKIIAYAEKIIGYCADIADRRHFLSNTMLVESCVFNLSQIGELVNKLDDSFREAHPNVPWRALYGLRNRIVHDYEGVNFMLVWEIIRDDLPALINELKSLQ